MIFKIITFLYWLNFESQSSAHTPTWNKLEQFRLLLTILDMGGGSKSPPYQLWSLTALSGAFHCVHSSSQLGHMGTLNDPDPKKAPKNLLYLSYTTCDEMIKKGPCQVWLRQWWLVNQTIISYLSVSVSWLVHWLMVFTGCLKNISFPLYNIEN